MGRRLPTNVNSLSPVIIAQDPYLQSCNTCPWSDILYEHQVYNFNHEKSYNHTINNSAITYKIAIIYNTAMSYYFKRQFTEAMLLFHKVCIIKDHWLRYNSTNNKESEELLLKLSLLPSHKNEKEEEVLGGVDISGLNSIKLSEKNNNSNNNNNNSDYVNNRDSTKSMIDSLDILHMTCVVDDTMAYTIKDINTDIPSKILMNRCKYYIEHPPPLDWDGVEHLTSKEG